MEKEEKKQVLKRFKLVLSGGPCNGACRYYSTLGIALREGRRYLHHYGCVRCLSDHLHFDVFFITLRRIPILIASERI